jgi:carnitine O-acetyltransferase
MPGLIAENSTPTPTPAAAASAPSKPPGKTFAFQEKLPHLPIPPLEDTCKRYLRALEALQDEYEHEDTKRAVEEFLEHDGPRIQQKLLEWAKTKDRYADESFLSLSLLIDGYLIYPQLHRRVLVRIVPLAQ